MIRTRTLLAAMAIALSIPSVQVTAREAPSTQARERVLSLEGGSNFRDLGGYATADGRHVRWGAIYRSAAMPALTAADYQRLARLNIRSDIDLRSQEERAIVPDQADRFGARYYAVDYTMARDNLNYDPKDSDPEKRAAYLSSLYSAWPVSLAPQYRILFEQLLADRGGVLVHCSAGQDRTGVASALVLAALGVPRATILADYHLTTQARRPEFERALIDPAKYPGNPAVALNRTSASDSVPPARPLHFADGRSYLEATFARIDSQWGSVERYLDAELGIDAVDIARLKRLYLE
ncbi:MAG: tyrosine-protein phosphatase [Sphingobium sp.]